MRLSAWVIAAGLAGGCKTDDTIYPILPGGGGPTGGGQMDAAVDTSAGDAGAVLHGVACLVGDLRNVAACATSGAGGFTVLLGTKMATTASTGEFEIPAPQATNLVWQVSGTPIATSLMTYSASSTIPVITSSAYLDLESGNGVLEVTGQGSILVHVVHAGAPVVMAIATTTPVAAYAPLYDGTTASQWNQSSTGAAGAIWVPGLPVGAATITITPQGGTPLLVTGIPIGDHAITFVTAELP